MSLIATSQSCHTKRVEVIIMVKTLETEVTTIQAQKSGHVVLLDPPKEDHTTTRKAIPKKPKLTEADQRELLISILLPYCKLKGNIVIVSIPTGTHYLKPSRNQPDAVKEWVFDQFHQAHGKAPMLQAYKAACTSIGVTLLSQVMQELSACKPSPEEGYGDYPPEMTDSTDAFSSKERVDGHDNLYIFDGCKIGRLKTTKEGD